MLLFCEKCSNNVRVDFKSDGLLLIDVCLSSNWILGPRTLWILGAFIQNVFWWKQRITFHQRTANELFISKCRSEVFEWHLQDFLSVCSTKREPPPRWCYSSYKTVVSVCPSPCWCAVVRTFQCFDSVVDLDTQIPVTMKEQKHQAGLDTVILQHYCQVLCNLRVLLSTFKKDVNACTCVWKQFLNLKEKPPLCCLLSRVLECI